tara:strand:- start:2113 stop:2973 length:861 start_codon:yes stop_codon:yes gene_type:complete
MDFDTRVTSYRNMYGNFLRDAKKVRLLTEFPGNIGDRLIFEGTKRLLDLEEIRHRELSLADFVASNADFSKEVLLIPGSGALTEIYNEWLPEVVMNAASRFERVVILASEYEPNVPKVSQALGRSNVFAFARDAESFAKIRGFGRAGIALDPALWAFDWLEPAAISPELNMSEGTLVALRTDRLSLLSASGLRLGVMNRDISTESASLDEFLLAISGCRQVVTDRLHVLVASIMLGKQVHYADPREEKISRYVRFTLRDHLSAQVHYRGLEWLASQEFIERDEREV